MKKNHLLADVIESDLTGIDVTEANPTMTSQSTLPEEVVIKATVLDTMTAMLTTMIMITTMVMTADVDVDVEGV